MLRVTLSLAETDAHRGRVLASHTTTVPVVHVTVLEVARGPSSRQGAWDSCAASVEGPRLHVPRPCAWFPSGRACADRGGRPATCRSPTLFSTRGPAWSRPGWAIPATHSHRIPAGALPGGSCPSAWAAAVHRRVCGLPASEHRRGLGLPCSGGPTLAVEKRLQDSFRITLEWRGGHRFPMCPCPTHSLPTVGTHSCHLFTPGPLCIRAPQRCAFCGRTDLQ